MEFKIKYFNELTIHELYQILQLRSEVFVVEQECVYQDMDFKDQKSLHIFGYKEDKMIAYTRVFKPGDYFKNASIGRVIIASSARKYGLGHDLIKTSIAAIKILRISSFYSSWRRVFRRWNSAYRNGKRVRLKIYTKT